MVRDAAKHLDADSIHKASMCAMAKLHVTENCSEIVSQALQMFGGYGYLKDYPIQQYLRDLRVNLFHYVEFAFSLINKKRTIAVFERN
nr:Acyl-CoA oxidase dehydrogenase domain containing protein [Haemonchus contortus]